MGGLRQYNMYNNCAGCGHNANFHSLSDEKSNCKATGCTCEEWETCMRYVCGYPPEGVV